MSVSSFPNGFTAALPTLSQAMNTKNYWINQKGNNSIYSFKKEKVRLVRKLLPNLNVWHHGEVPDDMANDFIVKLGKIASHRCYHSKAIHHNYDSLYINIQYTFSYFKKLVIQSPFAFYLNDSVRNVLGRELRIHKINSFLLLFDTSGHIRQYNTLIMLLQPFLNVMTASTFLLLLDLLIKRSSFIHSFNSRRSPASGKIK